MLQISNKQMLNYCPLCGKETKHTEQKIERHKSNLVVECPKHGELFL